MLVCTLRITNATVGIKSSYYSENSFLFLCSYLLVSGFKETLATIRVDHGTLLRGCHELMPCVQQIKFLCIPFTLLYFDREMSLFYPCSCRELFAVKTLSVRR